MNYAIPESEWKLLTELMMFPHKTLTKANVLISLATIPQS
jgi:hypothetical protein